MVGHRYLVNSTMRGGACAFLLVASRFVVAARTGAPTPVAVATGARIPKRLGLVQVLVGVLAFSVASTGTAQPKVYDTGYETSRLVAGWPSLHWIDNNRLLFAGIKTADMEVAIAKKEANREERLKKLYLWDASTNSVKLYADAKGACVVDGIVRYQIRVDEAAGKRVIREGPLGSEREVEEVLPSREEVSREPPVHSNFTCRNHLRSKLLPPAKRFRHVVVLREGDGYLDLEPGGGPNLLEERRAPKRNLVLYQVTGKAIELPMTWDEQFSELEVAFSAYRGAYILRPRAPRGAPLGIVGPWPKGRPFVVYLLWADGRVETISIPYFPTSTAGLGNPRPVKNGWIFGGGDFYKSAGVYLFDGTVVFKIDTGAEQEIAASPDGCKAAVAIQNEHLKMGTPTNLKIFDFCTRGR